MTDHEISEGQEFQTNTQYMPHNDCTFVTRQFELYGLLQHR